MQLPLRCSSVLTRHLNVASLSTSSMTQSFLVQCQHSAALCTMLSQVDWSPYRKHINALASHSFVVMGGRLQSPVSWFLCQEEHQDALTARLTENTMLPAEWYSSWIVQPWTLAIDRLSQYQSSKTNLHSLLALQYHVVDNMMTRRTPYRGDHLKLAQSASSLLLAGALDQPMDRSVLVFDSNHSTLADIEQFVQKDPYYQNNLIRKHSIEEWSLDIPVHRFNNESKS